MFVKTVPYKLQPYFILQYYVNKKMTEPLNVVFKLIVPKKLLTKTII